MPKNPVRIAVFCSGSASSFRYVYEHDPAYKKSYEIVGVFSDEPDASGITYAQKHNIPTEVLDFTAWCNERGVRRNDLQARKSYFEEVIAIIKPWDVEAIMLSGCMLLITDPLLTKFAGRILNVHPALLSITNENGNRKYTGLKVVERAMQNGDPTGSTVHIVTSEADMGAIITESEPLPYQTGDDPLEHQEKMKTACDGPAYQEALKRLIEHGWPEVPWQQA